jgi:hypothetical protein
MVQRFGNKNFEDIEEREIQNFKGYFIVGITKEEHIIKLKKYL